MTHYDTHYNQPTLHERLAAALLDVEDWLDTDENIKRLYDSILEIRRMEHKNKRYMLHFGYFACGMSGIQGLPATAVLRHVWCKPIATRRHKWDATLVPPTLCSLCADPTFQPSHDGSRFCKCGSIASGGKKAHCTCDTCF